MKIRTLLPLCGLLISAALTAHGQAAPAAPAGSTGMCKDGTYTSAAKKSGACNGHKGVQQWFGAAAAPSAAGTPGSMPAPSMAAASPAAMPAPAAAAPRSTRALPGPTAAAAPGGGPGMVWVNTASKVYHCPGDRYYGKTKAGKYMSESDAKAAGAKPDNGNACSK